MKKQADNIQKSCKAAPLLVKRYHLPF